MTKARIPQETPIAVIGAGTMGVGIAQIFAQAGHPVRLQARKRETLEAALRRIRVNQDELIRHELLRAADAEAARRRIAVTQDLKEALAGAAFVSENIPELLPPKQALFAARQARRPRDRKRTFGYRRFEVLAALANGFLLTFIAFSLACGGPTTARTVPEGAKADDLTLTRCKARTDSGPWVADCGTLIVRENPADAGSRLIADPLFCGMSEIM